MYRSLFSVGGLTLLSRLTGFFRDILLGAFLGVGALADAFFVALRIPNHFRAIFGEGAFNAAYLPTYARALEKDGIAAAQDFANRVFSLLLLSQLALLAIAWAFMPQVIDTLAPGFRGDPERYDLAVTLTRITFPYLLCVTLVTLHSGTLNAHRRFAAAAFAPVLLNLAMMATLGLAFLFPNAAHAAAWGVAIAGVLELMLVSHAAWKSGILARLARPQLTEDVRRFFRTIVPAVIGSAGVQIAILADTIIVSLLPTGAPSALYYADRIYQLPVGVIGVAAGTVILPEMSRRFAAGDPGAAFHAQNRTMAMTIMLAAPFLVAFLTIPEFIMRGVFMRGRFDASDAAASGAILFAYAFGLMAIVLIRSAVASFQAKGDTKTPMMISLAAVAVNLALKLALYQPWGAAGLAAATAVGANVNLALLVYLAIRRGDMKPDATLMRVLIATAIASAALAPVAIFGAPLFMGLSARLGPFAALADLALIGAAGALAYGLVLMAGLKLFRVRLARPSRG